MPEKKFRAVIIFLFENEYYALSYNRGDLILKSETIDTSFGMDISKLLLSKDQLNNITTFHAWNNPPLNYTVYSPKNSPIPLYKQSINNDFIIVNKISGNSFIEVHNSNGEILQLNTKIIGNTSLHLEGATLIKNDLLTVLKALKNVIDSKGKDALTWTSEISQLKETKKCNTKLNNKLKNLIDILESNCQQRL
ncbi:TIGR04141 family sporadically distributed protein [Liquorilactobacillus satsumensis]|uniref:TIGR04141 family sporadically distributed protein n=1 Tax=Liquorilactobacillus satsumensis TaxID=259059 RepID=UPI0039E92DAA